MPFIQIETSNYDSSETVRQQLIERLNELNSVPTLISKFMGIFQNIKKPESNVSLIITSMQKVWSCLLIFLLFLGLLMSMTKTPFVVFTIYLIGYIDFLFLFYYNWSHMEINFYRGLMRSSSGVGILKRFNFLSRIKNVSIFLSLVIVTVAFCLIIPSVFFTSRSIFTSEHFNFHDDVIRIFFIFCFSIALLSIPAANCISFCYLGQIMAEFEVFNNDFKTDENTYQLAVARHYAHAHTLLHKAFKVIRWPISYWFSIHLIINSIITVKCMIFLFRFEFQPKDVISNLLTSGPISFFLVSSLFQSLCIFLISIDLRAHMTCLRKLMIDLLTGQRVLHEQTYSLCIAFITHLHFHKYGLSFFRLTIIDRQLLNIVLILTISYILLMIQRNRV